MITFTNFDAWREAMLAEEFEIIPDGDQGAFKAIDPGIDEVVGLWGWWDVELWLERGQPDQDAPTGCLAETRDEVDALNENES